MVDPVRQEVMALANTVVIKVGTNVLAGDDGLLDMSRVEALADQIHRLRGTGRRVALVSSGAVGAGVGRLGLERRPSGLRELQACAAVGQNFLMRAWEDSLARYGIATGQLLLTAGDFDSRARYLNTRNTIVTLFEWGCLPIINENDTVSVAEIRFGDNDHLAALVTNLLQAPLLILLSVVEGLYTSDPRCERSESLCRRSESLCSEEPPTLLTTVPTIDGSVMDRAGSSRSSLGSGGMQSKLRAARLATVAGESVILANGRRPDVIDALFRAEPLGTLFLPHDRTLPAWKRWLGYTAQPRGRVIVDAGAQRAVQTQGRSLLPIGVVQVLGPFHKGDVITLVGPEGTEFARGLSNYPSSVLDRIRGLRTEQITQQQITGVPYEEVVHRDNLVVFSP